ncbi:MAG TPA: radical SAM protein [Candidatus Gallacutalibacter stercoravium]|nr:radical SAM protein [Candidatus Gallacutalibacter stercoravium]
MGSLPVVARAALHYWEEPCISGTRGSGAVFFSGCSLHCVYCQNYAISERRFGKRLSIEELAGLYRRLEEQGAHNINLVTADHFIPAVVQSLRLYRPRVPVVYNCSGYESAQMLAALNGLVDIYLPDFKYADEAVAARYSNAPDYFSVATEAIQEMIRQTGRPVFDDEGLLRKGTLVRHLILPGHTRNSIGVLRWLAEHVRDEVLVSLMGQFLPQGKVNSQTFSELNRRITKREYQKVEKALFDLRLEGFVQDLASAQEQYIPSFQLEGVEEPENLKDIGKEGLS